jgi:predicted SnoaL-like aldol condensation-catalyzing enzyme
MSHNQPSSDNERLVDRLWNQIWIEGALDKLDDVIADPFIRHTRDGTEVTTPAEYARHIESAVRTIRGTEMVVEHIASVDDMVFARLHLHGLNLSTGTTVKITWLTQYRIAEGRIAEAWTMHQSGLDW